MKVSINYNDGWDCDTRVEFDNGLALESEHCQDCCENNYLDFEQLHVGREFPDMDGHQFLAAISRKEDGFSIMDSFNVPAWVQARSSQNGYYSEGVDLVVYFNGERITPERALYHTEDFTGKLVEYDDLT